MNSSRGMAYCGLACCLCGDKDCPGCRNEGCSGKDWCKNYSCCREKGISGCWECGEFPCTGSMLDKPRIRAFARFIKQKVEEETIRCLMRNDADGIAYHYEGQLTGDYDRFDTEEEIMMFISKGLRG